MALVKVLNIDVTDLAEAYSDTVNCQATFDELVALAGENNIVH